MGDGGSMVKETTGRHPARLARNRWSGNQEAGLCFQGSRNEW